MGKKFGLPQVVGMIIAGILLGLVKLIPDQDLFTPEILKALSFFAKIGVILIMFSAGIETDLKQFKQTGISSIVITLLGVIVPVGLGFVVTTAFLTGFDNLSQSEILSNLFYGTILAATSVSITVASLKELGKLNSKIGSAIISAALLDDLIGIILLSILIGINNTGSASDAGIVIGKMIGFFVAAAVVGCLIHFIMKKISKKHPHTRRLSIYSIGVCFFFAYAAERWFSVADITGAYVAGLIFAGLAETEYIDHRIDSTNNLIFAPVFFANIGISANFGAISPEILGFGFAFVAVGILGKLIGCGTGAFLTGFKAKDSVRVGLGMMVRAEVVLVTAQKGIDSGMVNSDILPFILILIIITTLLTPLLLKLSYRKKNDNTTLPSNPPNGDITQEPTTDDSTAVSVGSCPNETATDIA